MRLPEDVLIRLNINRHLGVKPSTVAEFLNMQTASKRSSPRAATATPPDSTTFTNAGIDLPGVYAGGVSWFDVNNDGKLDIVLSGFETTRDNPVTRIYLNNGDGTFTDMHADLPDVGSERGIAWGDYNNDGTLDVFLTGSGGFWGTNLTAKLFKNVDGTFVEDPADSVFVPLQGGQAVWFDYDNDGLLDLLYSGSPDTGNTFATKLYRNTGSGFVEVPTPLPGVWGSCIAIGDYNNDGSPDVYISGFPESGCGIYENLLVGSISTDLLGVKDTTFRHQFFYVNSPVPSVILGGAAWVDIDNDGLLDLIVSGVAGGPVSSVFHNDGNDHFTDIQAGLNPLVGSLAVGDFDNDGYIDLAVTGSKEFTSATDLTTNIYRNVAVPHYTLDSLGDTVTTYTRSFSDIGAVVPGTYYGWIAWGDYDNDGRLDLLVSGATSGDQDIDTLHPVNPFTAVFHNNLGTDLTSPTVPSSANAVDAGSGVDLSWQSSSDAHTPSQAISYNIRVGSSPGASDVYQSNSNFATGFRRIPASGNASRRKSFTLPSLKPGTYYWSVQSVNNEFRGSQFSPEQSFSTSGERQGRSWRLVSLPIASGVAPVHTFFPDAVTSAYSYSGNGYDSDTAVTHGRGYWVKFPDENNLDVAGAPVLRAADTIAVTEGWNLIGSVGSALTVDALLGANPGMIDPVIYGYANGYFSSPTLQTYSGYWIHVKTQGNLVLSAGSGKAAQSGPASSLKICNTITVNDAAGMSQTLYFAANDPSSLTGLEVPPPGPTGVFDARYSSGNLVEFGTTSHTVGISISAATYPVKVSWSINHSSPAELSINGKLTGLSHDGSQTIARPSDLSLMLTASNLPSAFALRQNYPNPFNPTTTIEYDLPQSTRVSLRLYDVLGRLVATLVDGVQPAGRRSVTLNASGLSTGVYMYKIQAGSFESVQKLVLMK